MSVSRPNAYNAAAGTAATASGTPDNHSKEKVEDCRDYLRTGRCKYGASCKYNHPPNVQSGGGMKTPLNPTEPMFPIRPNEPICQYFMKHGTCKFGQACKFHHPPGGAQQVHFAAAPATIGPPMLLDFGPGRKIVEPATHLVAVGPPGAELTHMMVQFLPQRPEEPDCIYFLKNGRCKYGATCRYHHPIHPYTQHPQPRQHRHTRTANQNGPYSAAAKRIPYAPQPSALGHPPGHIPVAADAPVSFVNVDHATPTTAIYKPVTFITTGGDIFTATQQGSYVYSGSTVMTEQGSSASSVASSFDTASSSMDLTGSDATTAALWSRARKNGSGGSLNAFEKPRVVPNGGIPASASDGNIARRAHSSSIGSASDYHGTYADTTPLGSRGTGWRHRSSSFDQPTLRNGLGAGNEGSSDESAAETQVAANQSTHMAGRPPVSGRIVRHRTRASGDEGFTMMTSALLNMLDTQEEGSAEAHSEDEGSYVTGSRRAEASVDGSYIHYPGAENSLLEMGMMQHRSSNPRHSVVQPQGIQHSRSVMVPADRSDSEEHWPILWDGKRHIYPVAAADPRRPNPHQSPLPQPRNEHAQTNNEFGLYLP